MTIKGWCAIMFVGIVTLYPVISSEKRDMEIDVTGSWISPKYLADIIEETLNKSMCSNVYTSGDSVAIKTIFNDFMRIYPHEYIVSNKSYYCNGYFMIFASTNEIASVLEKVPTNRVIEMLIIVDDDVVESSMLFNVSMYHHATVSIIARSGLWTLSEFFLSPRVFRKISSHQEVMHKRNVVNLQGRELQAAAFFQPPSCYLQTTVNRTVKGIQGQFFTATNEYELDGVEVKLFLLMAEQLNFTWTIRKPTQYRYGQRNGTDWDGGVIGLIHHKEVDIAFTNIWLTLDYYEFTNMSKPWTELFIHFAVPRPKSYRSFWALTRIFSFEVWGTIFAMLIAQSVYVYIRAWISPTTPSRFRNIATTLTELMGRLVGVAVSQRIKGLRLQLQVWHFIGILLVIAYSSNLEARLSKTSYEKRIDTLQDFIAANLTWGRHGSAPQFSTYFDENDPYAKQMARHFKIEENEDERHRNILRGGYAIIGKTIKSVFYPEYYIRDEDFKSYRVMKESAGRHFATFISQPWLIESVSKVVLRLREAGFIQYHIDNVIHRRTGRELRNVVIERDEGLGVPRILSLTPLGFGFSLLIFGLAISSIVFYLELQYASGKGSIFQVLRRIKRNRDIWNAEQNTKQNKYPALNRIRGKKYGYPSLRKK